jgi:hypothetical protein
MKQQTTPLRSRMRLHVASRLWLAALLCATFAPPLRAQTTTVFTNSTLILANNTAYDGQNVVIDKCTVTLIGPHAFNNLTITNGAVLTQQPTTDAQEYYLTVTVTNNLLVDSNSSINASGCGYLAGYTFGNTTTGAASFTAGGSYGGFGGLCCGGSSIDNAVYGDYHHPNELGSGSGTYNNGSPGGGLVQITAGTAQVNGKMLANGGTGDSGGSGGGVLLTVGTLSGAGEISANGGTGNNHDGGGGGRVAIYYGTSTFNLLSNVTANGGGGPSMPGSVGTVYLQPTGGPGQLIINNHGTPVAQYTPLGAATDTVIQVDMLIVSGTNVVAAPEHQMAILADSVSVTNGGELTDLPSTTTQTNSLLLTVTNTLLVDGASTISVTGTGYLPGYTLGNTTNGAANFTAGGSYGGLGGLCCNGSSISDAVYGDYHNPNQLGSGSGTYSGGSAGGGLLQIAVGTADVNGTILANGGAGDSGGSGGSLLLNVTTLTGIGKIAANGGAGNNHDGGGGGRVAIYYGTSTFNFSSNVTANGGSGPSMPGSVGTVYLQPTGGPDQLIINNHGTPVSQYTPLGSATDTAVQVDMLIVSGTNVVALPEHQMPILADSISITNGGQLTDLPTTATQEYSLLLTVTNTLFVDGTSTINVTGCGYLPGYTQGNTNVGGATYTGGGTYGGLGGLCCGGTSDAVYGDYHNPEDLGSGSGTYDGGASGGGLAQITAASLQLNGKILANGGVSDCSGSGGGILLSIGTLSGTGQITANGGNGTGHDGGGGGRVAIYYSTSTFNLSNNVTAFGGHGPLATGSAGTVYLQQAGSLGQLVINNDGEATGQWTLLGQSNDMVFSPGVLVLSGAGTVAATISGAPIQAETLSVLNGAVLTQLPTTTNHEYSLELTVTNSLIVDATSTINVSGSGYLPGYTVGNTTIGAAVYTAGGSYGGLGGLCCGSTLGAVYGDYHFPRDLGSGSGTYDGGASGGGLAQITAASLQLNGKILANGGVSDCSGSGGGILLNIGTLSGAGQITANGGNGTGHDGGGGGRVAIYYGTNTFNLWSNVTAIGGYGPSSSGSVGTVYLQQMGDPGLLIIDNFGAVTGQWTPLGAATDTVVHVETLLIAGTNVVVAPEHQMPILVDSISITNGAVLTHQPTTTSQAYSLLLTATNHLLLDGLSSINVSGYGYLPAYTLNNTAVGGSTYTGGGSYGGLGGICCGGSAAATYGDYHNPANSGSGSGTYKGGAPGGGLIQITAGTAQLDGTVLAVGGVADCSGSGGGILLNVETLSGAGLINANGGRGTGHDGGGGGRVAIYYGTSAFTLSSNVTANGGYGPSMSGSAGTVYLQQTGTPGQLVINNDGQATGQWTPLGLAGDVVFSADTVVLTGAGTVAATPSGAPIQAGTLSLINGAVLTHQPATAAQAYSLVLTVTSNLLVDAASSINVSGFGYLPGYTLGNTTVGAATWTGGGSYGGLGGLCCGGTSDSVYGDYHYPNEPGSGSGTYDGGASGGGLVQITAASAQLDGMILANGGVSDCSGSGGGIYVNVGTLSGAGQISANGGRGTGHDGGGGGRVAIYYDTNRFNLSNNVTANGGFGPVDSGAVGTVYFQQSGSLGQLVIDNHGTPTGQWTPLGVATNTEFQVDALSISGTNVVVAPQHQMSIFADSISITNGAEMTDLATTASQTYSLVVTVTNNLFVDATSTINVSGNGYLPGYTLGDTTTGGATFTAGGSYGGMGGLCCGGVSDALYGNSNYPENVGSGSGTYNGGASGGGLVQITAGTTLLNGSILANGGVADCSGSGGGILLNTGTLSGTGLITANGGEGTGHDGGGGGRVAVYTWTSNLLAATNILANGGYGPSASGSNGSVYITSTPYITFLGVSQLWHGVQPITFTAFGLNPNAGYTTEVVVSKGGTTYFQQTTPTSETVSWDTTTVADGIYTLTITVLNASSASVGTISQNELVNNSLTWHEGLLTANQTWGSNTVNGVDQTIIIPNGVTLTIAPGAIVKFAPGTGIIVQPGGILNASGATVAAPIVFASLADDTVGGDSEDDGGGASLLPGGWSGIGDSGQFNASVYVQIRDVVELENGIISANQEWFGGVTYIIAGDVTVPSGVTLAIDPGAVVKFALGLNITVESGGTLIANGTVAQPIAFTSINDESIGAVTNGVPTIPAAGDWDSIYLNGGSATFDHVTISYGGGPNSLNSGLISLIAPDSVLSVSDSTLSQGFYKGIQAEYGTANVTNCLITGCDRGIQPGLSGPTVVNVINCTIDNNNYGILAHGGVLNVANTIVSDSLTTGIEYCCGSSPAVLEYCDVWSATGNNYSGVSYNPTSTNRNISVNPNFIDAAAGNYELSYGSACINSADGAVAPLTDLTGAPCYNVPDSLPKTGITNSQGLYPDMGAYEYVEGAPSDVDLVATSVSGPASVTAGQTVTVQWNDVNIGASNAVGPWHDSVSLAGPGGTNLAATVLVAQSVVLGAGQSYAASALVTVPGGLDGNYHWQVHVNSQGDVFEGANWTNNITSAVATTVLSDPTVTIGGASLTNAFTGAGQSGIFAVVSSGGTFVLNVQGSIPGCALEVFVGDGYVPNSSHFDFQSSQFNSPTASVTVPNSNDDTYYVLVHAVSLNASTISYTLSATQLAFALTSVSPASMANSGPVTLQILGDQLADNDTCTLTGPGGAITASSVESPDPSIAYATFNLGGAAAGLYSLKVAQPAGPAVTLPNAVSAVSVTAAAAAPSLSLQLEAPPAYRKTRPFEATVVYRDSGEVNLPAPILVLSTGNAGEMELEGTPNYVTGNLVLIGASFEGPAGTLTPDNVWSFDFTVLYDSCGNIPLSVDYITATATNLIDYTTLETALRPPGYCADTWTTIWTSFQAQVGPTWGGFVTVMDSYSTELALTQTPGTFYLLQDVLAYAFAQLADGGCTTGLSLYPPTVGAVAGIYNGPSQSIPCLQSGDPNAKFAAGVGLSDWVAPGDPILYTIDFANETNASGPAQLVTVTDPLTPNLNWSTLQLTAISFNNVIINIPPGVQTFSTNVNVSTDPNPVAVTASLNPATGVLTWLMESIDPVTAQLVTDPLAGFLPPDNAQGQGEGFLTYTVVPASGLATGAQITNQAIIVFDVNAPIPTPVTTNLLDAAPPTSSMTALPANSATNFPVSWTGQDVGSGIADFNIYVSTNGGPWAPWVLNTTNTSALFSGANPGAYAFYSVAYDEVGLVEASPIIPGASTVVPGRVVTSVPISIARSGPGTLALTWSQGALLQATNLAGPWTTNTAASPYTVAPTNSQMYFKLLVN